MEDGKFFAHLCVFFACFARNLFRFAQSGRFTQSSQRGRQVRQGGFRAVHWACRNVYAFMRLWDKVHFSRKIGAEQRVRGLTQDLWNRSKPQSGLTCIAPGWRKRCDSIRCPETRGWEARDTPPGRMRLLNRKSPPGGRKKAGLWVSLGLWFMGLWAMHWACRNVYARQYLWSPGMPHKKKLEKLCRNLKEADDQTWLNKLGALGAIFACLAWKYSHTWLENIRVLASSLESLAWKN